MTTPFFGIVYNQNRIHSPHDLSAMAGSLEKWGHASASMHCQDKVVFGQFITSAPSQTSWESVPTERDHLVIMGSGRLDNRRDLCDKLGIPYSASISNNRIVANGYHQWGKSLSAQLLGDWACVIWDKTRGELLLARDQMGLSQVYYYQHQEYTVFSTLIQPILKCPSCSFRHNPIYVSKVLLGVWESRINSQYEGLKRLLPGQQLRLTYNNSINTETYWSFEHIKPIRFKNDKEYEEAFLEIFTKAVADRMVGAQKVGLWLSSGLDSSSILALMHNQEENDSIHSFTSIPTYKSEKLANEINRYADESTLVNKLALQFPKLETHFSKALDITPLSAIHRSQEVTHLPQVNTNMFWIWSLLDQADQLGVDRLLTGEGGNMTISYGGFGPSRKLDLALILRLIGKGEIKRKSLKKDLRALIKMLAFPFLPGQLLNGKYSNTEKHKTEFWSEFYLRNELITPDLIESIMETPHEITHAPSTPLGDPHQLRQQLIHRQTIMMDIVHSQSGGLSGRQQYDPTLDIKVIEFCLGLPNDQFARLSRKRLLIKRAMTGRLPNEVLWNKKRGLQGADFNHRLLQQKDEILEAIRKLEKDPAVCHYVNLPKLFNAFSKLTNTSDYSIKKLQQLHSWYLTLSTSIWISEKANLEH